MQFSEQYVELFAKINSKYVNENCSLFFPISDCNDVNLLASPMSRDEKMMTTNFGLQ